MMGVVDMFRVSYLVDSLHHCWWWWRMRKSVWGMLMKLWRMRWRQIRRICCGCGMRTWGYRTPLGPRTAVGADAVAGGGECDDDRDADGGGR